MSIESDLIATFIQRLREREEFNEYLVEALQKTLTATKPPKSDDIVRLIYEASGEALA